MNALVSSAEAAYIANVTDRQINHMVDARIAPLEFISQEGSTRRFARFFAALARFYYGTEHVFQPSARRLVMQEVASRVHQSPAQTDISALIFDSTTASGIWHVVIEGYPINVEPYIAWCSLRAKNVDQADALVHTSDEVLGGIPVFLGTRLPIDHVLAALQRGSTAAEIIAEHDFLTPTHIEAARVYDAVHPRRGRPARLKELHPDLRVNNRGILRTARK